jgi:hypothetical protein
MLQPEAASAAAEVESHRLRHKRTVILIELPFFSFCAMISVDMAEGLSALLDDDR